MISPLARIQARADIHRQLSALVVFNPHSGCAEGVNHQAGDQGAVCMTADSALGDLIDPRPGQSTPAPDGPMTPLDDRCLKVDVSALAECCEEDQAHCVPAADIPEGFRSLIGDCADGCCVPDKI